MKILRLIGTSISDSTARVILVFISVILLSVSMISLFMLSGGQKDIQMVRKTFELNNSVYIKHLSSEAQMAIVNGSDEDPIQELKKVEGVDDVKAVSIKEYDVGLIKDDRVIPGFIIVMDDFRDYCPTISSGDAPQNDKTNQLLLSSNLIGTFEVGEVVDAEFGLISDSKEKYYAATEYDDLCKFTVAGFFDIDSREPTLTAGGFPPSAEYYLADKYADGLEYYLGEHDEFAYAVVFDYETDRGITPEDITTYPEAIKITVNDGADINMISREIEERFGDLGYIENGAEALSNYSSVRSSAFIKLAVIVAVFSVFLFLAVVAELLLESDSDRNGTVVSSYMFFGASAKQCAVILTGKFIPSFVFGFLTGVFIFRRFRGYIGELFRIPDDGSILLASCLTFAVLFLLFVCFALVVYVHLKKRRKWDYEADV